PSPQPAQSAAETAEAGAPARSPKEQAKRQQLMAMAGFAVTVFLFMFYKVFFTRGLEYNLPTFGTMLGLALGVAAVAYVIARVTKL
ncbi:MAG: hypothetical protein HUU20_22855, partial [Pirellulales bacterium]|nr:hypothetical protein [Pirellulales bacterium]